MEEHTEFKRINDDLVTDLEISLKDAILGGKLEFRNFDGIKKELEIKPGTQSEDKILFKELVYINFYK